MIGEIRALEDEQDPERRKMLVKRLLAALDVRELPEGFKARVLREMHWSQAVDTIFRSLPPHNDRHCCPKCGETQNPYFSDDPILSVRRVGTMDENMLWDEGDNFQILECDACGAEFQDQT